MASRRHGGGVGEVANIDPHDTRDVGLVRTHPEHDAGRFRNGDFSDPTAIYGTDMPGVYHLEAGPDRLEADYVSVRGGERVAYASTDPVLVDAPNARFDAQTSDHGIPGMGG